MRQSQLENGEKGLIFNIQKFSVHDGPGIRTTVFMKGCPLQCLWCSNPESQNFFPELMVRDINCKSCGACVRACPQGAIIITKKSGRTIDRQKCDQCLLCVESCLYDSLKQCGTYMTVREVLEEVLQDKLFYKNSGGGVTISGGEPLSQSIFTGKLLEACKKEGLNTALETTGVVRWNEMEKVLRFVDLTLFDIKHLNSDKHQKMTGTKNNMILENLRKTAMQGEVWLRVPLINGFNDSENHIQNIALLGGDVGAKKISLLPYHAGGQSKSEQLGKVYAYPDGKAPGEKHTRKLQRIIEKAGLTVSVGN
jgi:pyruvate formate lyase activating enzyme